MKRPCAVRFCKNPAISGSRFCLFHTQKYQEEKREKNRDYARTRQDKFINNLYKTDKWKKLRSEVLSERKTCEECGERKAEEVHHIVPVKDGGSFFDKRNLIALCKSCHAKKHR